MDHHGRGGFQDRVLHVCRACHARATSHAECERHRRVSHHRFSTYAPLIPPGLSILVPLRRPR
jgi:hypothetical protein